MNVKYRTPSEKATRCRKLARACRVASIVMFVVAAAFLVLAVLMFIDGSTVTGLTTTSSALIIGASGLSARTSALGFDDTAARWERLA